MTVPPYAIACAFCVLGGYLTDRFRKRGYFVIGFLCSGILGFIMLVSSSNAHVKYAGTVFAAIGIYSSVPPELSWNSNNVGGSLKRSVAIAMHVGL